MFENLQVYQKAMDFADKIASHPENFPRGYYFLVDQLNRAALSIATKFAEGNGRFTKPDRKNFFTIARGSVHCNSWISLQTNLQMRGKITINQKIFQACDQTDSNLMIARDPPLRCNADDRWIYCPHRRFCPGRDRRAAKSLRSVYA